VPATELLVAPTGSGVSGALCKAGNMGGVGGGRPVAEPSSGRPEPLYKAAWYPGCAYRGGH
jgi:hypothetical protein